VKYKRPLFYSFVFLILAAGIYWIFFRGPDDEKKPIPGTSAIVKRVMNLSRGDLNVSVTATGVITPINIIEVKSKASGVVEQIPIESSDRIRIGQLIARLDQTDTRNAFEQALADSQVAVATLIQQENNWKRAKDLFDKQLISQQEFDQINVDYVKSKSNVVKANSALLLARQKLAETIVLSPVNGIVLSRNVSAGQIIASAVSNVGGGTTIARVANMDEVYMIASVDEVDIGRIRIGQEAKIVADAYPDRVFYGKVVRIAAQATVTQNVTTFDVVILVPNRENRLKAGMNGTITIDIYNKQNVLLISNELLRDDAEIRTDMATLRDAGVEMNSRESKAESGKPDSARIKKWKERKGGRDDRNRNETVPNEDLSAIQVQRKFVVVQEEDKLLLRPVEIGAANFDYSEVISGLTDSTKVVLVKFSQAKLESERRKEMLKNRMGSGMTTGRRN